MEIEVSIICLAYNQEEHIRSCLQSFVNQKTNFKYEVIVNDDCSTDNTASIIKEFEEKYPDIIKPIYQTENQYSQGNADKIANEMFAKAKGKYFAECEGDDVMLLDTKLQRQYDYMEAHPECYLCTHGFSRFNCVTRTSENVLVTKEERDIDLHDLIGSYQWKFATSSIFIKREVEETMPQCYNSKYFGDIQIFIYAAILGKVHYIPEIMSQYTTFVKNSATAKTRQNKERLKTVLLDKVRMFNEIDKYYNYDYHNIFARYCDLVTIHAYMAVEDYKSIVNSDSYRTSKNYLEKKDRLKIVIGCRFPKLLKFLLKIKR